MITDALILIVMSLPLTIRDLLPYSSGFPAYMTTSFNNMAQYFHMFDSIIPTSAIFDVIFLILIPVELAIATWWTINYVGGYIRGNK